MNERPRIAILGGGVGAISAAFELTNYPGWQENYEITVYTLGWRLGGKGASGRNSGVAYRVEEHGLHVWFGCYQNAFHMMRAVYQELADKNLAPNSPLQSCFDAFQPHDRISLVSQSGITWTTDFGVHGGLPGDEPEESLPVRGQPEPAQYLTALLESIGRQFEGAVSLMPPGPSAADLPVPLAAALRLLSLPFNLRNGPIQALLGAARALVRIPGWHDSPAHHSCLRRLVEHLHKRLFETFEHKAAFSPSALNLLYNADLYLPIVRGMIADQVLFRGFEAIDDNELREWLTRHGAVLADKSPVVKVIYDPCFAYKDGDPADPNLAAGTALQAHFRLLFTHKGHISYVMQAGMGDIVFAPLYLVLKERGVKFEFFQRVLDLGLSNDGKYVDTIKIEVQKTPPEAVHKPLLHVKGLPVWPSKPCFEGLGEIEPGSLESQTPPSEAYQERWLKRGEHFDTVILGISLGALPVICRSLIASNGQWKDMIENVKTTPTQAVQIWLNKSGAEMGWDHGTPWPDQQRAVAVGFVEPYDSFADFSHVLPYEDWGADDRVRQVLCLCNCLPLRRIEDCPDPQGLIFENALEFLRTKAGSIFPNGTRPHRPNELDWNLLVDRQHGYGPERLRSQYFRANFEGSELYVLSVAGSTRYRLHPAQSGFDNLYLAGDWTWNDINIGCVEAAVISARLAAHAIWKKYSRSEENKLGGGPSRAILHHRWIPDR